MDLISFDTPGEFKMFEEIMARGDFKMVICLNMLEFIERQGGSKLRMDS